jgi:hypothetical protein
VRVAVHVRLAEDMNGVNPTIEQGDLALQLDHFTFVPIRYSGVLH